MSDKLTYTFEDLLDQVQVGNTVYDGALLRDTCASLHIKTCNTCDTFELHIS